MTLLDSTGQVQCTGLNDFLIAGELALSGEVRKVKGGFAMAILAKEMGKKGVLLPRDSAMEACLIQGISVYPVDSLAQTIAFFDDQSCISPLLPEQSPLFLICHKVFA